MMKSLVDRIANTVGKGENGGYQHFPICPKYFPKLSFTRNGMVKVNHTFGISHSKVMVVGLTRSYFFHSQEHFLVPDHTIKDINGASFAGFYYICFQKSTATIEGYYYHRSSEW